MPLHIYTDDEEFVIAESAEEAAEIYAKSIGYADIAEYIADVGECPWHQFPDDRRFRYHVEEGGEERVEHELPEFFCKKYGKGYFASSNA